jgi:hypothetical protein
MTLLLLSLDSRFRGNDEGSPDPVIVREGRNRVVADKAAAMCGNLKSLKIAVIDSPVTERMPRAFFVLDNGWAFHHIWKIFSNPCLLDKCSRYHGSFARHGGLVQGSIITHYR